MENKITKITPDNFYKDKPKWKVTFDNGSEWTFFAKEKTKHDDYNIKPVGHLLNWDISNAEYNTARSKDFAINKNAPANYKFTGGKGKADREDIAGSVAFKGAIELCNSGKIQLNEIAEYTTKYKTLLLNI
jgi:hypothetical protein|tara:strand:- start:347 stop:739 length:393 start_codon:yes stop_codon:yes gene_type:complete